MSKSKIEWTDRTWNPVTGCTKVSQGCKNCYAERMYERFNGHGTFKNVLTHPERLTQPLHWKKPSMVFVNSMSDLFHEEVPFAFINSVFSVMADCDQHTYQVLTKRPERMLQFYEWKESEFNIPWQPSENVWLGVSVENQETANERIPLLLHVSSAVRFLSCEPLLGPIDLTGLHISGNKFRDDAFLSNSDSDLHWIICGGESGPHARPMNPEWARSLRDQCKADGIPFFFKQWGEWGYGGDILNDWDEGKRPDKYSYVLKGKKWKHIMNKVGKKAAGNFLDGEQYLEFPKVQKLQTA